MAQYKKDKIKESIDRAAALVFSEKGYRGTKISDISKQAQVSVGNIYRYYRGKDEIFYTIVPPGFIETLKNVLAEKVMAMKGKDLQGILEPHDFEFFNNSFIGFMIENRESIIILLKHGQGSKYEDLRSEIISFLTATIKDHYKSQYWKEEKEEKFDFVIELIYDNLIHMVLGILEAVKNEKEAKAYLEFVQLYHLFGITELFR